MLPGRYQLTQVPQIRPLTYTVHYQGFYLLTYLFHLQRLALSVPLDAY